MDYQELKAKYPRFIFEDFQVHTTETSVEIEFTYQLPPDHIFVHRFTLQSEISLETKNLNNLAFHLGLSLIPSYWKAACSPVIEIKPGKLSDDQLAWWHKLFIKGMGEYYYKNQIDFTAPDFLTLTSTGPDLNVTSEFYKQKPSSLVMFGGGKDSLVTLELVSQDQPVTVFTVNPTPAIQKNLENFPELKKIIATSTIDPHLLDLNKEGYLNGHVPFSAFLGFAGILAGAVSFNNYIIVSNERSSNEGNTQYLGAEINHQYSKTSEFENDLNKYLQRHLHQSLYYFSFLRPLYELQITKLFAENPTHFPLFTSCNTNFKLDPATHPAGGLWCKHCPKCVSTALLLAPFIGREKVIEIMGAFPPELADNALILSQLLGDSPVKPFECVLTRAEARAAYEALTHNKTDELSILLASWEDSQNLPAKFALILKNAIQRV